MFLGRIHFKSVDSHYFSFLCVCVYLILSIFMVLYGDTINQGIFPFIHWIFKGKVRYEKRRDCLKGFLFGNPRQ